MTTDEEIERCGMETDHANVVGTGFCSCTHVMFCDPKTDRELNMDAAKRNPRGVYWSDLTEAKRKLYVALLSVPVDDLTDHDADIMELLARDPGIQAILDASKRSHVEIDFWKICCS